jgi:LysR family transcriptional regulator, regulator of abg operon
MHLNQIRNFLAVAERGGIRAAARKLGVSQPTITKSVRGLERELHTQLLARSARGIELTAAGRAFFARARIADAELRKAEEEAAQPAGATAAVAFGVGNLGAALIVAPAVTRFRRQFPRSPLRIVEGLAHLLLPTLRDGSLDFVIGLRAALELHPALRFRPLYRSELAVAARKGHPLRHARRLAELAAADWLSTATLGLPDGPIERLFAAAGLTPPRPHIQCESYNTMAALLAGTDMVALMQRRTLQEPLAREQLAEIPVADPLPSVAAGIFTRADAPLTRAAAAMAKAASVVARGLAPKVAT